MRGLRASIEVVLLLIAATVLCVILTWGLVSLPFGLLQHTPQANAGNAFNGAAAVGSTLVLIFMVRTLNRQELEERQQREELRLQREELRLQREVLQEQCAKADATNSELHRTSEALIRGLHMSLLRLAMADPDLAATWPGHDPDAPAARNKQFLYVNQVLSLYLLAHESGYPDSQIETNLRRQFASPVWLEFWETTRADRADRASPEATEADFFHLVERAYQAARGAVPFRPRHADVFGTGDPSDGRDVAPGVEERSA